MRTAVFDATDRLEYESELLRARRSAESSESRVRILQDVSSTFGVSVSDEDVAQAFTNVARDAFSATETAVLLRTTAGLLQLVAGVNPLADKVPPIDPLRNTPLEIASMPTRRSRRTRRWRRACGRRGWSRSASPRC